MSGNIDFDRGERLFFQILHAIDDAPIPEGKDEGKFWTDFEKILCKDKAALTGIADLIDDVAGYGITCTGYYDPEEDARTGCVDKYTGYHYLELAE